MGERMSYLGDRGDISTQKSTQNRRPSYAFFIHPRDVRDVIANYPHLSDVSEEEIIEIVLNNRPTILGEIHSQDIDYGIVIGLPLIPMDNPRRFVDGASEKIRRAALYARNLGCRYIGTGALSAALSGYGKRISDIGGLVTTTGHTLTAWSILKNMEAVSREFGLEHPRIAVVGAVGSVGRILSKNLRLLPSELVLIDVQGKRELLDRFGSYLQTLYANTSVKTTTDLYDLNRANIIVTVTNAPRFLVDVQKVEAGRILLDDAQPWGWDREQAIERFAQRNDILGLDAGLVRSSKDVYDVNVEMRLNPGEMFACLGELILLRKYPKELTPTTGLPELGENNADSERLRAYDRMAEAEGLDAVLWTCGNHKYTEEELSKFKNFVRAT